jgi:putative DNA primase/helicase
MLFSLGLEEDAIFEPKAPDHSDNGGPKQIERTYPYENAAGELLYEVVRFVGKDFRQRRPDGHGSWIWNLKGVQRTLYRLPLVRKAVESGWVVIVVEGEKDADTVNKLAKEGKEGYVGTCNSGGAGKWTDQMSGELEGAMVIISIDDDKLGMKHGLKVLESVEPYAKSARLVKPAQGKDLTDHVNHGLKIEELIPVDTSPPPPAEGTEEEVIHHTDTGNSLRFVREHGDDVSFVRMWKKWFAWDGTHWCPDDDDAMQRLGADTITAMFKEAQELRDDERSKLLKHALNTESEKRRNSMIALAASHRNIARLPSHFDQDIWKLTLKNGTMNLETGELNEHCREDHITHCLDLEYDATAECPTWIGFLIDIFDGREELIQFVQRAMGYTLTGSTREQCFFLLYGSGSNGKSTFLEVMRHLMGRLAQNADFSTFLHRDDAFVRNDIARMRTSRMVTAVETEGERRFSESILKALTGGDTVTARQLYSEFFEFRPMFKLWLAANHRPVIRGIDHAIWRRVRLVPFTRTIPDSEQDRDLTKKLLKEINGVFAWAVEGCKDWIRYGLGQSESVLGATTEYREDMDPIGPFLEECCIFNTGFRIRSSEIYQAYLEWAKQNGRPEFSHISFGNLFRDRKEPMSSEKSGGVKWWRGLALKSDREEG